MKNLIKFIGWLILTIYLYGISIPYLISGQIPVYFILIILGVIVLGYIYLTRLVLKPIISPLVDWIKKKYDEIGF